MNQIPNIEETLQERLEREFTEQWHTLGIPNGCLAHIRPFVSHAISETLKEAVRVIGEIRPNYIEHQEDCLIRYNKKKGCSCGAKQNSSATDALSTAITAVERLDHQPDRPLNQERE